jgi:DNA-binding LytR/AlgR family response regulator
VGEHYKSITDSEIACFYIWERATFLRTTADNEYVIDHSLDNLQKMLDPSRFFRVNRYCIVNINQISDMVNYSSSRLKIILKSKKAMQDIIVSKDKVSEFKKWIDK